MRTKFKILFVMILTFTSFTVSAQKITISGYIKDAESGESLIGATIYNTNHKTGTVTNNYGFYTITFQKSDTLGMVFSYIGYIPQTKKIAANRDMVLNVNLMTTNNSLGEVVVNARRNDSNVRQAQMGVIDVPLRLLTTLPAIGGENDILKVIQLLPGVQSGKEGNDRLPCSRWKYRSKPHSIG